MSNGDWCLIESDPAVFTELISGYGASGVEVEEIFALEKEFLSNFKPIHGLIFLFKMRENDPPDGNIVTDVSTLEKIFFTKQVISNACATQALLSILLNVNHKDLILGKTLSQFKEFCLTLDPYMRGLSLSNEEQIRGVHNSFSRPTVFELDDTNANKEQDSFHFVSYVPIDGHVYELDGLRAGPIDHGKLAAGEDWLDKVTPILQARMSRYQAGEVHFNLLAVNSDKKVLLERRICELKESEATLGKDVVQQEVVTLQQQVIQEESKRKKYKLENIRRRHNYIPFIMELLKVLSRDDRLSKTVSEFKADKVAKKKRKLEENTAIAK